MLRWMHVVTMLRWVHVVTMLSMDACSHNVEHVVTMLDACSHNVEMDACSSHNVDAWITM